VNQEVSANPRFDSMRPLSTELLERVSNSKTELAFHDAALSGRSQGTSFAMVSRWLRHRGGMHRIARMGKKPLSRKTRARLVVQEQIRRLRYAQCVADSDPRLAKGRRSTSAPW